MSMAGKRIKKGEVIPVDVVNDIIDNRFIPRARDELAKKHGISSHRVYKIWVDAFGGGTIDHAKNCKKVVRPQMAVDTGGDIIEHSTPRGKYKAPKPKNKPDARANPKVIKKPIKYAERESSDLDLDKIASGDLSPEVLNQQANIISGQIQAGNDNSDLAMAIRELIENNKHLGTLTRATYDNLLAAKNKIDEELMKKSEDDTDNIKHSPDEKPEFDDSTKIAPEDSQTDVSDNASSDEEERRSDIRYSETVDKPYSRGRERRDEYIQPYSVNTPVSRFPTASLQPVRETMERDSELRVRPTKNRTRAQPIHKIKRRPNEPEWSEESANNSEDCESEQEIHTSKQLPLQRPIQSHNARDNDKHYQRSRSSAAIVRPGRDRPSSHQQVQQQSTVIYRPI